MVATGQGWSGGGNEWKGVASTAAVGAAAGVVAGTSVEAAAGAIVDRAPVGHVAGRSRG